MAPPESLLKQNYNAFSSLSEKRFAVSRLFRTTKQPKVKAKTTDKTQINIHPHSGWYFIFGYNPNLYRLRINAPFIGLPATHPLLATLKRVLWIKHTQLIALFILL